MYLSLRHLYCQVSALCRSRNGLELVIDLLLDVIELIELGSRGAGESTTKKIYSLW